MPDSGSPPPTADERRLSQAALDRRSPPVIIDTRRLSQAELPSHSDVGNATPGAEVTAAAADNMDGTDTTVRLGAPAAADAVTVDVQNEVPGSADIRR